MKRRNAFLKITLSLSGMQRVGGCAVVVVAVCSALFVAWQAYRQLQRRDRKPDPQAGRTTAEVEASGRCCAVCGSELFLDAAENELACPRCMSKGAVEGLAGTTVLDADGSYIDFDPSVFSDVMLAELVQEVVQSILQSTITVKSQT